jgi:[ribosomal protein S18]-alanine N-acetyltransferase
MNAVLSPVLRPMQVSDLDSVMAVEVSSYAFPWSRGNFQDSLLSGYHARVARAQGSLRGYFVAMPGVQEMHLLNVTVAPEWQGQGLGAAMLESLQADCRHQGLCTLWLEVRQSNEAAQRLYRRLGFEAVGQRKRYYPAAHSQREDAVVMRKELAAAGQALAKTS